MLTIEINFALRTYYQSVIIPWDFDSFLKMLNVIEKYLFIILVFTAFWGFFYPHKLIRLAASERSERGHPVAVCGATENLLLYSACMKPQQAKSRPQQSNDSSGSDQKKTTADVKSRAKNWTLMRGHGERWKSKHSLKVPELCEPSCVRDSALILQMALKFSEKLSIVVIVTLIGVSISL